MYVHNKSIVSNYSFQCKCIVLKATELRVLETIRMEYFSIQHSIYMKSSDAKASKCHLKFSSKMIIFIKLVQWRE